MTLPIRMPPTHFADWFRRHAVTRPYTVAISTPRATLTYRGFHRALHEFAYRLSELGVERGQTIGVYVRNQTLHCVVLAALNRMGCVSFSIAQPGNGQRQIPVPDQISIDRLVVEAPCESDIPEKAVKVDLDWLKPTGEKIREWTGEGFSDRDAPISIFASSGTTGKPKAIEISTRQWESRVLRSTIGALGEGHEGKKLSILGVATGVGYRNFLKSFWAGGSIFAGWPTEDVPNLIARRGVRRIEGSPDHYAALLRALDRKRVDISGLQWLFVTGSAMPRALLKALRVRFRRPVFGEYGSTELGHVSLGILNPETPPGHCGFLAPWIEAQAVDEDGRPLPPGTEGTLRFRHDFMANAYVNDPVATAAYFKDGWFFPGDIGVVSEERALSVTGRSSELINAGGLKISPDVIEDAVYAFGGIVDCAAFASPDQTGIERIAVALVLDRKLDFAALRKHCHAVLGLASPQDFKEVPFIPRGETGKIRRSELLKLAEDAANHLAG